MHHQVGGARSFNAQMRQLLAKAGVISEADRLAQQERAERLREQAARRRRRSTRDRVQRGETAGRKGGGASPKHGRGRRPNVEE